MIIRDLGLIGYGEALAVQERLAGEVRTGGEETLLLLEHSPVYTLGAGGDAANLLNPCIPLVRVNRGGDVTYHGPGQLVGYPILDLDRRGRDLHRYLRFLEEFLLQLTSTLGIEAFTVPGRTGVWTGQGKLAAIGVGVRRWVSMHGFCLNVSDDTSPFDRINPCGMPRCRITSLSGERGETFPVEAAKRLVQKNFTRFLEQQLPRS